MECRDYEGECDKLKKRPLCCMCLIFLIVRSIIFIISGGHGSNLVPTDSIFYEEGSKSNVAAEGVVYKKTSTSKCQILYLKNSSIYYENQVYYESRLLVYDEMFSNVKIGNRISVRGDAKDFEEAHNPGNFDSKYYYACRGLYGSVWSEQMQVISSRSDAVGEFLFRVKEKWNLCVLKNMSSETGGIMMAMLMGDKSEIEEEIKDLYQKNGISHILAISGLHISFLGLVLYQLFRRGGCPFGVAGILSGILLFLYVLMIGMPISAMRAFLMLLLRIGADVSGRKFDMATAVSLSACITIVSQPLYLGDAGFLMSYGAIAGILLILPAMETVVPKWMATSLAIQLMLNPILLYYYFELPPYSVFLNLLIIPLASVLLTLGVSASIVSILVPGLGNTAFFFCDIILKFMQSINVWANKLPFSSIVLGRPSIFLIIVYYVLVVAVVCFWKVRGKKEKKRIGYVMGLFIAFGLLSYFHHRTNGNLMMQFLDVGQGDCILICGPNGGNYMVDAGSSDVNACAKYRVVPALKAQGITRLDFVFVTHGDSDHYGGIKELLQMENRRIEIGMLVFAKDYDSQEALCKLKTIANKKGVPIGVMERGMVLQEGGLKITCIQPGSEGVMGEENAKSLVLDVAFGSVSFLLTGDVEKAGEEELIDNLSGEKSYTVLKVAHHGSKHSSSEEVLENIQPQVAIISAGRENSYGHPHWETLKRIGKWTRQIYSTAVNGCITVKSDGKTISVEGFH